MDSEASLKRFICKKGIPYVLEVLSSPNLPEVIKEDLSDYFIDGHPNDKLIYSLATNPPLY